MDEMRHIKETNEADNDFITRRVLELKNKQEEEQNGHKTYRQQRQNQSRTSIKD